jgi:hypothetical protein
MEKMCSICEKRSRVEGASYCRPCLTAYNKIYREYLRANPDAAPNQKLCTKCGKEPRMLAQRWCLECDKEYRIQHAEHKRQIKSPEARKKERTRGITRKLILSGVLVKEPCKYCGDTDVEAHHPDYDRPEYVWWVCRECHKWKVHGGHI